MTTDLASSSSERPGNDRPLKILQIHNHYREGGGEDTVVAKEAALLRGAGHTVFEVRTSNPTDSVSTATSLLISPWNVAAAQRIKAAVLECDPDVAHVHNTWWALSPSVLRSLETAGVPVVMTLHNYRLLCANGQLFRDGRPCEECVGTHPWRGVQHRCYRNSAMASIMAAGTIALNRRLGSWDSVRSFFSLTNFARDLLIAGGLPERRVRVKPNFVEDPGDRGTRASESSTVLYVGRISSEKGVNSLLDAWSDSSIGDLELVLAGDGPERTNLQNSGRSGVRFLGLQTPDEVRELMLSARTLVFPSTLFEGQPMVLLEALAAGLPVIASDVGGVPETIADSRAAMFATPGDPSSWVSALERLQDENWVDAASSAARTVFEHRYTPEIGLRALTDEYARAMANRSTRD